MFYLAKVFEALGIATVGLGLVLGINSPTLWIELFLSIIGIVLFLVGRGIEKLISRKQKISSEHSS